MAEKNYKFSSMNEARDYIEKFSGDWYEYDFENDYVNSNVLQTVMVLSSAILLTYAIAGWNLVIAGIVGSILGALWAFFIIGRMQVYPYSAKEVCVDKSGYVLLSRKGIFVDSVRMYLKRETNKYKI